ncbi:hypothetical protein [Streptomyces sp. NPDC005485]
MNVTHFNGGLCAEPVVIGTATARGAYDSKSWTPASPPSASPTL